MTRAAATILIVVASVASFLQGCEAPSPVKAAPPEAVVVAALPAPDPVGAARRLARTRLDANDVAGALVALEDVLARDDDDAGLRTTLRCEWAAVVSRRARAETGLRLREKDLRAAFEACPTEAVLKQALADTLLGRAREQTDDGARLAFLHESVSVAPSLAGLVDLALLHERQNEPSAALEAITAAEGLSGGDERIAALKARLQKTATVEQTFKSARHSHFVARFEGYGEERLAWAALDTLEQAWFRVGTVLDLHPVEPITVVIYTGEQYRQATGGPDWSTGLFDGKIRIREGQLAADKGSLDDTLVHEYVHAALHTLPVAVPSWFHEGLAQHFEARRTNPKALMARVGVAPRGSLDVPFTQLPADVVPAAYATAHAVLERMVERRGDWGLNQLIAELKSGRGFDDAFRRAYAVDVDALYREATTP